MAGLATSLGFAGTAGLCCLVTDNPRGLSSLKSTPWTSTPAAMNGFINLKFVDRFPNADK